MEWTRSETLGLASIHCTTCHGLGLRKSKRVGTSPCNCVLRSIFRACFRRFRQCVEKEKHLSECKLEYTGGGRDGRFSWGRKDEEFIADFLLMVRRELNDEEQKLFRLHYLLGADHRLCCSKLKIEKNVFFYTIYRVEQRLGRAFRETEPYGLFPLDEYFHGTTRGVQPSTPAREGPAPLQPPMAEAEAEDDILAA